MIYYVYIYILYSIYTYHISYIIISINNGFHPAPLHDPLLKLSLVEATAEINRTSVLAAISMAFL